MSKKVVEFQIDSVQETRVESVYTKSCIRVMMNNKEFVLLEIDCECSIPGCNGDKCSQNKTTIAKIRKSHRGNCTLKRRKKEQLLDELPMQGKRRKQDAMFEVTMQEGDFDDDDEEDEEIKKFMLIQIEEYQRKKFAELLEKRETFLRLMTMWVKILEYYQKDLNKNEVHRMAVNLYFKRAEDFEIRQLKRLEARAINIMHTHKPTLVPNPRKLPKSILSISMIDKRRWIDPSRVTKHDYYGTVASEIEDEKTFNYLYNKAKNPEVRKNSKQSF